MEEAKMYMLKGCIKCEGDLFLEGIDWRCLQCGKYYYAPEPVQLLHLQQGPLSDAGGAPDVERHPMVG